MASILPVRMTQRMCDNNTPLKYGEIGWRYNVQTGTCELRIGMPTDSEEQLFGQAPQIGAFIPIAGEGISINSDNEISLKLEWTEVSN